MPRYQMALSSERSGVLQSTLLMAVVLCKWDLAAALQSSGLLHAAGRRPQNAVLTLYSDTSANEDNSFRNHIR